VTEPATAEEVAAWIAADSARRDPYEDVRSASDEHRVRHGFGCTVYPTSHGPLLGLLVRMVAAASVFEVGTGLGYSTLWLASGGADVETVERDAAHAALARETLSAQGARAEVVVGPAIDVVRARQGPYDLVFCDADPVGYAELLEEFVRILRPGGALVSANLFLRQFGEDIPGLDELADYRERIVAHGRLQTAFVPGGMALSLRR
jgi:predicted O-methyltransferase YrrM